MRVAASPVLGLVLGLALAASTAAQGPPPPPPPVVPPVPVPPGNPITPAKALLGKALFWDEQLSSTRTMACGTCHVFAAGGSDPRSLDPAAATHPGADGVFGTPDDVLGSPGVVRSLADGSYVAAPGFSLRPQVTGRKAPTMVNAAFAPLSFWDGRAGGAFADPLTGATVLAAGAALESQAAGPPVSDVEMGHVGRDWGDVAQRVAAASPLALATDLPADVGAFVAGRAYPELFADAFGTPEVTPARVAMAIATYERTLVSDQAPVDVVGGLTPLQQQGRQVFNGPGRCNLCHGGPLFTDQGFHNVGARPPGEDEGRFAVTGIPADRGRFKTPTLRNVGLRGPYFHHGGMPTLEEVVLFYDRGGDFTGPLQDPLIQPLGLTPQQRTALVAFLRFGLTDPRVALEQAPFDRPTLYSESSRVPEAYGAPSPGAGGAAPSLVALEPPLLGNPSLTLGLDGGLGGAPAVLALDLSPSVAGLPLLGATVHVAASPALRLLPAFVQPSAGTASWTLTVPAGASALGLEVFAQAFVLEPTALAATAAARMTVF